jgi:hypothetical protein
MYSCKISVYNIFRVKEMKLNQISWPLHSVATVWMKHGRKETTMSINEMFNATENNEATANARSLAGTAQLTAVANELVASTIKTIDGDFENYKDAFAASKSDHSAMDALLAQIINFDDVDVEFIKELDEATVDGMLKSQQSKRSRAKSKAMTMDNYKSMMTGAIAENLIRKATGKAKSAGGARRMSGSVDFTAEQLEALQADQEQLNKEIRNVQSKKSIMKSKADFSEEDERWQKLLVAEEQLKSIRISTGRTKVVKVDETKEKLAEVLADVDPDSLKAGDSKALLAQIKELLG